jgi:hypothetical protein
MQLLSSFQVPAAQSMAPAALRTTNWGPDAIRTTDWGPEAIKTNAATGIVRFPCAAGTPTTMVTCGDTTQPLPNHQQRRAKEYHRTTLLGQAAPPVTVNPATWVAGQDRVKAKTTAVSQLLAATNPSRNRATTVDPTPVSVKKKRVAKATPPKKVVAKQVVSKKK